MCTTFIPTYSRDVISLIGHNGGNKGVLHDGSTDRLPVWGVLPKQNADALQGHFDHWRGVAHGANLHQILFLDPLHRCMWAKSNPKCVNHFCHGFRFILPPYLSCLHDGVCLPVFAGCRCGGSVRRVVWKEGHREGRVQKPMSRRICLENTDMESSPCLVKLPFWRSICLAHCSKHLSTQLSSV